MNLEVLAYKQCFLLKALVLVNTTLGAQNKIQMYFSPSAENQMCWMAIMCSYDICWWLGSHKKG